MPRVIAIRAVLIPAYGLMMASVMKLGIVPLAQTPTIAGEL